MIIGVKMHTGTNQHVIFNDNPAAALGRVRKKEGPRSDHHIAPDPDLRTAFRVGTRPEFRAFTEGHEFLTAQDSHRTLEIQAPMRSQHVGPDAVRITPEPVAIYQLC